MGRVALYFRPDEWRLIEQCLEFCLNCQSGVLAKSTVEAQLAIKMVRPRLNKIKSQVATKTGPSLPDVGAYKT